VCGCVCVCACVCGCVCVCVCVWLCVYRVYVLCWIPNVDLNMWIAYVNVVMPCLINTLHVDYFLKQILLLGLPDFEHTISICNVCN